MATDEGLKAALDRYEVAMDALRNGDATPYIDSWARDADVTLYGAWGPVDQGWETISDTLRWVARRFSGGTDEVELTLVGSSGDLAYSVGFERDQVSIDHAPSQEMILRVTQVYRRIDGRWWVVHRHADVLPADQRKTHP